ncbi:MAG: TOBE domain-containing protein, partial [Alphaproteobacteria bacterium]|nr:TOBE domain-containing protein [Alphaproteobacteria bacterium]
VRPEALQLIPAWTTEVAAVDATVIEAHTLGPASVLALVLAGESGQKIMARVPGIVLPPSGAAVRIAVEHAHALVFPRAAAD